MMKTRKNLLLFVLILAFSFMLAACCSDNSSSSETDQSQDTEPVKESEAAEPETTEEDINDGNILITYFSHTGNTEKVAQRIAEYTGRDLARIQRAEEYGDLQEEAETEILDGVHPEITVSVDSIDEYGTIFVGYPIWNADLPMPLYTFLEEYDFSGKTIIPFTTHGGSGFSGTVQTISELQPNAAGHHYCHDCKCFPVKKLQEKMFFFQIGADSGGMFIYQFSKNKFLEDGKDQCK